ncbi:hypothetical protein PR048_029615 [Dryococelus australis]|uniref:HTH CENPB-type domain-containing protein n=1 Tax=Dryococelus australis TaxID=614101 RepID=A0ABQ9GDU9_9NEOP|nr:hypothetical protein PR048_029615 [Dryococelus australis]
MPKGAKLFSYDYAAMEAALKAVKEGMSILQASKQHGVPYSTLHNKSTGKSPQEKKLGGITFLTKDEENMLVLWANTSLEAGFPVTQEDLLDSVQYLVKELTRGTPFQQGRPGRRWYYRFLRRHPDLALRTPQTLTSHHVAVTPQWIMSWFNKVETHLHEKHLEEILQDPRRMFNGDETTFFLNLKGSAISTVKGSKNVHRRVIKDDQERLTVLIAGNAGGDLCPPLVCFKYEQFPQDIISSMPPDWGLGKSASGWMTGEVFFEYITNIFHTWLVAQNIPLPVILFTDCHTSHLTMHTSKFCKDNGIVLMALPPKTPTPTHGHCSV